MGAASPSTYHHCPASPAWAGHRPCLLGNKPCVMAGPQRTRMRWDPSCCCSTWEPAQGMLNLFPRECSITSVQKTASWGTEMGEICLAATTAQTGAKKLVWGAEHQSCPGATGELCYTQSTRSLHPGASAAFRQLQVYPCTADSPAWLPLLQESPLCAALRPQWPHFHQ